MIQEAAAMGYWWLAASSQQHSCSCIMSHAELFGERTNHPSDSAPYSLDLVLCDFWLFPKLKSPLKGKRFQTVSEIQENTVTGELCEVPRCLLWRGLRHHCPMYHVSCILYLVQSVSLFFIWCGWILSGQISYGWREVWIGRSRSIELGI